MNTRLKPSWERPLNINIEWFFGLDEEAKIILNKQLVTNEELFDALRNMIERKHESLEVGEFQFDSPAFTERLIYSEGYKKALKDLYRLLPTKGDNK